MTDAKTFNLFVASPNDVEKLRVTTKKIIDAFNRRWFPERQINDFFWEIHANEGAFSDIQSESVFQAAFSKWGNERCDILLCLTWLRFGEYTRIEFERFIDAMRSDQTKLVLFMRFAKMPKDFDELKNMDYENFKKLCDWENELHNSGIVPLGREIGKIKTYRGYVEMLEDALARFIIKPDIH